MRIDDKILGVKGLGILMLVQQPWADNFFYSHWLCTGTYKDFIHQGLHNSQKKIAIPSTILNSYVKNIILSI